MLPILRRSRAASFIGPVIRTISSNQKAIESDRKQLADIRHMPEFPLIYPDFLQTTVWGRRNALAERLQRRDMLERRVNLDIPEFYVGSIVAVTAADPNLHGRERRFMGICIRRERHGLLHQFTLRNCIEGLGIEVMFELYNPTLRKIEVIQLQKRLDDDLSYLIDALPEYSTFDTRMEVVTHPAGMPVPVNPLKVKMRPPPWCRRWDIMGCNGIEDAWTLQSPYFKRKFHKTKMLDFRKYDIVADYRVGSELEYEMDVQAEMLRFELEKREAGLSKRRILRSVMQR